MLRPIGRLEWLIKMKIRQIKLDPYNFVYAQGYKRFGAFVKIESEEGSGEGDLAPLPERSRESLLQAMNQLQENQTRLTSIEWNETSFLEQLAELHLLPSVAFALESALFTIFTPQTSYSVDVAALLMGNSLKQILTIATERKKDGFTLAKLKIGNLPPADALTAINELKGMFKLRIDVNSRWSLSDSIRFFSQFPIETFDYIEDPVPSIDELRHFPYPIAVEEPISKGIPLALLETIPTLKAVYYKPTVQSGYLAGLRFKQWADKRGVAFILSSSIESDIGHYHLVATAGRLKVTSAIGIGTYHYLDRYFSERRLVFRNGKVSI